MRKFSSDLVRMSERLSKKSDKGEKKGKPAVKTFDDLNSAVRFVFESWKSRKKKIDEMGARIAGKKSTELIEKGKDGMIIEVVDADRKGLIKTASNLIAQNPKLTVVLVNKHGDLVGMSKTRDMDSFIKQICRKCKGKGGGRKEMVQGKISDIDRFMKLREQK